MTSRAVQTSRCRAVKRNGEQCLRHTKSENGLCNSHISQQSVPIDSEGTPLSNDVFKNASQEDDQGEVHECPVCLESMLDERPLKCGHHVHIECVKRSMKPECPICRTILDLPKDVMKQIDENLKDAKREWADDDEAEIMNMIMSEMHGHMVYEIIMSSPLCDICLNPQGMGMIITLSH